MPRIVVSLSEGQKELWVVAAHDARVSLSEWVRRACDARAGLGPELEAPARVPVVLTRVSADRRPFRPDPKGGSK